MTAGPETPFNIDTALGALSNNQLRALIGRAGARQAERGTAAPATPLTEPEEAGGEPVTELALRERAFMQKEGVTEEDADPAVTDALMLALKGLTGSGQQQEPVRGDPNAITGLRQELVIAGNDATRRQEIFSRFEPQIAATLDPDNRDRYDTLLQLRVENAWQEQEPGADEESIDRFMSANPALAGDLFAQGGREVTSAFSARQRFRNRFLWAVTLKAGVDPNQLTELAQMETAAMAARLQYERSPGMENFTTKLATAVAYYQSANEIRGKRAAFLQKLAGDARLKFNAEGFLERDINP